MNPWIRADRSIDPLWKEALYFQEPSEIEYYQAHTQGFATNSQQERTLRILAWWRRNDAFRNLSHQEAASIPAASESTKNNLEALLPLLGGTDDNQILIKAKILRQIGQFDYVQRVLDAITSSAYISIVNQLVTLCKSKDVCVRQLRVGR